MDSLSVALGRADPSAAGKARAANFRRYAAMLQTGTHVLSGLAQAIPVIILLVSSLGLSVALAPFVGGERVSALLAAAVLGAAALTRWWGTLVERIDATVRAYAVPDETLAETKEALKTELAGMTRPIVVVVDDIDRLTRDEVLLLFQLVKANTDFPNLVFLLLFDRRVVAGHLGASDVQRGADYFDKIIQVAFDVPAADQDQVYGILFAQLNPIVDAISNAPAFDEKRWANIFHGGLKNYFTTLRNVYRYVSMFRFHVGVFKGSDAFEVNMVDLLALEAIRVFDPEVYARLPAMKGVLTGTAILPREAEVTAQIEDLVNAAAAARREGLRTVLTYLFPPLEKYTASRSYSSDFHRIWEREGRVCAGARFDAYFRLSIAAASVSESDTKALLDALKTPHAAEEILRKLNARGAIRATIDRLIAWEEKVDARDIPNLIDALSAISDDVSYEVEELGAPQYMRLLGIAVRAFMRVKKQERAPLLLQTIRQATGFGLVAGVLDHEENRIAKNKPEELLLEIDGAKAVREEWVRKIASTAKQDSRAFLGMQNLAHLLSRWMEWGQDDSARVWVDDVCKDIAGIAALVNAFSSRALIHSSGDQVSVGVTHVNLESLTSVIPEATYKKLLELPEPIADADCRRAAETLRAAMAKAKGEHQEREAAQGGSEEAEDA